MEKILVLIIFFYSLTLFISCGMDYSDPQKTLQAYIDYINNREYKKAYELISTKSKEYATEDEFVIDHKTPDSVKNIQNSYKITPIERDFDKPTYRRFKVDYVTIYKKDTFKGRQYFTLTNENDKWEICYVKTIINQANDKFTDGNYTESIKIAEKAIEINPYSGDAYERIGWCYYADNSLTDDNKKAGMLKNFEYAITIEPDQAEHYNSLSTYYSLSNEYDIAIVKERKAIELTLSKYQKGGWYANLSMDFDNANLLDSAIFYAKKGTEFTPEDAFTWKQLGQVQNEKHNYNESNVSFEKALSLPPMENYEKIGLYYSYAENLIALNNLSKAKEYVLKGLDIEPNNEDLKNLYDELKSKGY